MACGIWENNAEINRGGYSLTNTAGVAVKHAAPMEEMPDGRLIAQKKGKYFQEGGYKVAFVDTEPPPGGALHVKQAFVAHRSKEHQNAGDIAALILKNWTKGMMEYDKAQLCPEVKDHVLGEIDLLDTFVGKYSQFGYETAAAKQTIAVTFDKNGSEAVAVTQIRTRSLALPKTIDLPGELSLMYYIETERGPEFIMCVALPNNLRTPLESGADGSGPVPVPEWARTESAGEYRSLSGAKGWGAKSWWPGLR